MVVDSLMKIGIKEDDHDAQYEFMEMLCEVAEEEDMHVHIVMHPRKAQDEDSVPGKLDVKGSGTLTDLAWNVFSLFRNKKKERKIAQLKRENELVPPDLYGQPDALLNCSKQREGSGWEGNIALWFDKPSGCFLGHQSEKPKRYVEWSRNA